jgi:hypothetical protein
MLDIRLTVAHTESNGTQTEGVRVSSEPHPNSLEASEDPRVRAKIIEGRAAAKREARDLEFWARHGFCANGGISALFTDDEYPA